MTKLTIQKQRENVIRAAVVLKLALPIVAEFVAKHSTEGKELLGITPQEAAALARNSPFGRREVFWAFTVSAP